MTASLVRVLSRYGLPAPWTTATCSVDDGGAVIIGDDGPVKNQGTLAMTFLWVLVGTDIIIQKVRCSLQLRPVGKGTTMQDSQPSEGSAGV